MIMRSLPRYAFVVASFALGMLCLIVYGQGGVVFCRHVTPVVTGCNVCVVEAELGVYTECNSLNFPLPPAVCALPTMQDGIICSAFLANCPGDLVAYVSFWGCDQGVGEFIDVCPRKYTADSSGDFGDIPDC